MNKLLNDVYQELKYRKRVKNQTELGALLGYNKSYFSTLMNSDDEVPEKAKTNLSKLFGISRTYLDSNGSEGQMFLPARQNKEAYQGSGVEESEYVHVPTDHLRRPKKESIQDLSDAEVGAKFKEFVEKYSKSPEFTVFDHELRISRLENYIKG